MSGLGEQIGRALSDANKSHILAHQRDMNFRELGEIAAKVSQAKQLREALREAIDACSEPQCEICARHGQLLAEQVSA